LNSESSKSSQSLSSSTSENSGLTNYKFTVIAFDENNLQKNNIGYKSNSDRLLSFNKSNSGNRSRSSSNEFALHSQSSQSSSCEKKINNNNNNNRK
jgi:hypothetical protein